MLDEYFPSLSRLGENDNLFQYVSSFHEILDYLLYVVLTDYHNSLIGVGCVTLRLNKIPFSHFNSQVVVAIDLYSASTDDLDTVCCFLVFQDIGELPKRTNHPVRDRRVKGQPA